MLLFPLICRDNWESKIPPGLVEPLVPLIAMVVCPNAGNASRVTAATRIRNDFFIGIVPQGRVAVLCLLFLCSVCFCCLLLGWNRLTAVLYVSGSAQERHRCRLSDRMHRHPI